MAADAINSTRIPNPTCLANLQRMLGCRGGGGGGGGYAYRLYGKYGGGGGYAYGPNGKYGGRGGYAYGKYGGCDPPDGEYAAVKVPAPLGCAAAAWLRGREGYIINSSNLQEKFSNPLASPESVLMA